MSGGSYDYAYAKVQEVADRLINQKDDLRRAFGEHLQLVAKAMHDVEWVDSGDFGQGGDVNAIQAVVARPKEKRIELLKKDAQKIIDKLERILND